MAHESDKHEVARRGGRPHVNAAGAVLVAATAAALCSLSAGAAPTGPQLPSLPAPQPDTYSPHQDGPEGCRPTGQCIGDWLPYSHPLQGSELPNGLVPVLEIKNSPSEHRLAVEEGSRADEDGVRGSFSGIAQLEQHTPGNAEIQSMYQEKLEANGGLPNDPPGGQPGKLGQSLRQALASMPGDTIVDLMIRIAEPGGLTTFEQTMIAVGRDAITTQGQYRRVRQSLLAEKRQRVYMAQQPVVDAITQRGGQVTGRYRYLAGLTATLELSKVMSLAASAAVDHVDLGAEMTDDIDGHHVRRGTQIAQFVNDGYDGENGSAAAITFAVIEGGEPHDGHVGFKEYAAGSLRARGRYNCTGSGCTSTSNFINAGSHATAVNGILWGDLTDDQDSAWTVELDQKRRSGYAGEAWGYLYQANTDGAVREAFDHLVGRNYLPHVVNASFSFYGDDPSCLGETSLSKDANDLFEEGVLLIKSAGNNGSASSTDCEVGSPGSAIGVFTVGGHGNSTTSTDYLDVETAPIYTSSSLGGVTSSEGKNRTIVDVTAYACREQLFDTSGGYSASGCGTSYSTPTVAAAAVDHIDHYKNNISDFVDDPGVLYAHLLLMGDRENGSGKLLNKFDPLWGAGRLKMRQISSEGLDAPYQWRTGYTCVDDSQTVTVSVNNGVTLSSDVDYLKAIVWWYDPRHEKGRSVSDIDLRLKTTSGTTLRSSLDYDDNKERVFHRGVGGQAVKLEINGWDVKTDTTSCGSNSMKVYYSFFYEDDDRDDSDGPGNLIDPE